MEAAHPRQSGTLTDPPAERARRFHAKLGVVPRGRWVLLDRGSGRALFEAIPLCKPATAPDPRPGRRGALVTTGLRLMPGAVATHGRWAGSTIRWGDAVWLDGHGCVVGVRRYDAPVIT